MQNWSGHVTFAATGVERPTSVGEVQQIVSSSSLVRALGTAHSFNAIADTSGMHVNVANLPGTVEVDSTRDIALIPAGMRYGEAAELLNAQGWALHNMASLGHISVAGSIATGTHGAGDRNKSLAAAVTGLEMVTASGDLLTIGSRDADFDGYVVGLGALGVTTRVEVQIQPTFNIRQYVFDAVPHTSILSHFDEVFSSAYSVSYFTCWAPEFEGQVWMKRREGVDDAWTASTWMGGHLAEAKRHPLPGLDGVHCTEQGGALVAWHEALPHFKLDFTPSSGDELQTEYLVPRDQAVRLLRELESLAPLIHPLLHVSEIRTVAADELWLSGAYGRDTVGIHFTWKRVPEVLKLLPQIDALLGPHGGRPHWGKLTAAKPSSLAARYPRFDDFARLAHRMDPGGKFRNATLDALLSSAPGGRVDR